MRRLTPPTPLTRLVEWFIPARVAADVDQSFRARVMVWFSGACVVILPLTLWLRNTVSPGSLLTNAIVSLVTLVFATVPFVLRHTGRPTLAAHLALVNFLALIAAATWLNGGLMVPVTSFLPIVPLVAMFLGGWRLCLGYGGASLALTIALTAGTLTGVFPPLQFADVNRLTLAKGIVLTALSCLTVILAFAYERARRQAEALATDLAAASTLAAIAGDVAHQVNSPLTVITLRSQQLRRLAATGSLPPLATLAALDAIDAAAGRAAKLTRLLAASTGDHNDEGREPMLVLDALTDAVELARLRHVEHAGSMVVGPVPPEMTVVADGPRLTFVLLAMLDTALERALGPTDQIRIAAANDDGNVTITVVARDRLHAADSSRRDVSSASAAPIKARGLGLTLARQMATREGARLSVHDSMTELALDLCYPLLKPGTAL